MPTLRAVATSAVVVAGAPQVDQDTDAIRADDTVQKAAEMGFGACVATMSPPGAAETDTPSLDGEEEDAPRHGPP